MGSSVEGFMRLVPDWGCRASTSEIAGDSANMSASLFTDREQTPDSSTLPVPDREKTSFPLLGSFPIGTQQGGTQRLCSRSGILLHPTPPVTGGQGLGSKSTLLFFPIGKKRPKTLPRRTTEPRRLPTHPRSGMHALRDVTPDRFTEAVRNESGEAERSAPSYGSPTRSLPSSSSSESPTWKVRAWRACPGSRHAEVEDSGCAVEAHPTQAYLASRQAMIFRWKDSVLAPSQGSVEIGSSQ